MSQGSQRRLSQNKRPPTFRTSKSGPKTNFPNMPDIETEPPPPDQATRRKRGFTLQQEIFIFCCLMLITCLFLPWQRGEDTDVTPWNLFSSFNSITGSAGALTH